MPVATVKPSLDEFIRTVHQEHPDVSETELTAYWNKTYGSAEPSTTSAVSLPSLPVFLKAVKETHPDIPEYELRDYWQQEYGSKGARETEPTGSDFTRGFSTSIKQVPQLAYGVVAGVGAAGESLAGDGGLLSGVKQAGVKGYQEWGKKIAKESKSSDSFSYAYNRAKDGDFEALVDFVQYGLGYAGGQAVQMLATAGVGSVGGKLVLGEVAKKTAEKMVAREAAALSAAEGAATLTAEQIAKQATANAAAKIGQMAALAATATGMEGGEIFGDLASRSMEEGRTLNGDELAKAFGTTLAAGALEFVGDKIGLDLILGRSPLTKLASSIPGMAGKVARGTMAAGADALTEGATEYAQTKLEQVGKGHDPFSDAAQREAIDSAALGVVGGAVVGGASGLLSTAKVPTNLTAPAQPPAEQPVMPASTPPAEQPVMPASTPAVSDILDPRSTLDQAIATALKIVDAPAVTPEAIDAAIDLANRTAVEGGLRLPTQAEVAKSEHPAEKRAGHPIPILNGPAAAKLGPTIEVGSPPKPLAEQEPDAREAIAAERARLLAMQRPKAPVQPEPEVPAAQPQPDKPLRTALELAYPSVDQIHALAESMGMKWDNDPTFMELTKLVTGKSHLDELTPFERQQFADKLSSIQAKTSGEPAAPTRSTTPKAAPPPVAPATDETATASGPEAMVSRPRHELPPIESDYLRELAEQAASRVASGQPGRRQSEDNINAPGSENSSFGSSYPDWYGELKMSRQDVFKALDKIIKDNGADVGAQVERVKEAILNDPELEAFVGTLQEWHAAATGTKKPPQTGPTPLPEELPTPAIQRGTTQPNALEPEAAPTIAPEGKVWRVVWADGRGVQYFEREQAARSFQQQHQADASEPELIEKPKGAIVNYGPWREEPERAAAPSASPQPETHDFSTVQINLPPVIAQEITRLAARIPDADLAEEGREDQPHITVKYGLHADTADEVRAVLEDQGPITIKVGRLSVFPATDERASDVLKIDVESDQLRELNARITDELETTATQDDYKPHITVAYMKLGLGKKYAELTNLLLGKTFTVDAVTFSDKNEQQEQIAWTKAQPLPGELFAGRETMEVGAAPIIGREVQPEEAPLFSKAAQTPEPEQPALPIVKPEEEAYTEQHGQADQTDRRIGGEEAAQKLPRVEPGYAQSGWDQATRIKRSNGAPATLYRDDQVARTTIDFTRLGGGTQHASSGLGAFFTFHRADAAQYGPVVSAFYLDLRNPLIVPVEDLPGFDTLEEAMAYRRARQTEGYDGLILKASHLGGPNQVVAFFPEQIIPQPAIAGGTGRAQIAMEREKLYHTGRASGIAREREKLYTATQKPSAPLSPIWYSKLERTIEQRMPEKASPAQIMATVANAGVKAEELDWLDLDGFLQDKESISKQDVLEHVRQNNVQISEVMKGVESINADKDGLAKEMFGKAYRSLTREQKRDVDTEYNISGTQMESEGMESPKFPSYTLPGGRDYRELLLTLPFTKDSARLEELRETRDRTAEEEAELEREAEKADKATPLFMSSHWSEPNVLAHIRFNTRTDEDGWRVLFIEEVQSDWHQLGKRRGYQGKPELPSGWTFRESKGPSPVWQILDQQGMVVSSGYASEAEAQADLPTVMRFRDQPDSRVPDAPFKKTWHELVLKRMLRYAAEHGFDKLAWTTGTMQAERYDLSKQIDAIRYAKAGDEGFYRVQIMKTGSLLDERTLSEKELPDFVGKDVAGKIVNGEGDLIKNSTSTRSLSGLDLKVGGEGMKGFYDQIVPAFLNKYGKRWGAQVGDIEVATADAKTRQLEVYQRRDGVWRLKDVTGQPFGDKAFDTREAAEAEKMKLESGFVQVHALPITEAMKQSVLTEGQVLFENSTKYAIREGEQQSFAFATAKDALGDLDRAADSVSSGTGALGWARRAEAAGIKTVGLGFTPDLIRTSRLDLRGQIIDSPKSLAVIAQLLRDPRFETFRIVYVQDDGAILGHEAISSRLPNSSAAFIEFGRDIKAAQEAMKRSGEHTLGDLEAMKRARQFEPLAARMKRMGATGYYLMHNHPSGHAEPSREDIDLTRAFATFLPGFKGHVVIDSNEYAEITEHPDSFQVTRRPLTAGPDRLLSPAIAHPLLGQKINGMQDAAEFGKRLQIPDRYVVLAYLTGQLEIRAIQEVPVGLFTNLIAMRDYLRGRFTEFGATAAVSYFGQHEHREVNASARALLHGGYLMDHVNTDAQLSLGLQDEVTASEGQAARRERMEAGNGLRVGEEQTSLPDTLTDITLVGGAQTNLGYAPAKPGYQLEPPSRIDNVIRVMEDKNIDIRRMVDAIKAAGREVSDNLNPVLHEEMYMGRLAKRTQDFLTDELDPLVKAMTLNRVTLAQLDEYLHARHAKEANAYLKSINPDREDNDALSGMTDAEADRILGSVDTPKMERLASRVDAMVTRTRHAMVEYGLESQDTVNEWAQQYAFYVPLHREGFDQPLGTGQGRSVRGPSTKVRTGSTLKVTHILANIAMQRERTITRGEKMRPVIALAGLLMKNPNRDLAALAKPVMLTYTDPDTGLIMRAPGDIGDYMVPMIKALNKRTGTVESRPDPNYKGRDNVVNFRLQGKDYAVVFNEHNERSMEMAKALKDLDVGQLNTVLAAVAPVTRYLASINTHYNPVFGIVNFIRDIQFAMLALSSTPLAGQRQDILSYTIKALRGIYADARAIRRGERGTSDVSKLWGRFQDVGGPTGYRDLFRTSTDRAKAIEHMLNPEWWQDTLGGNILTAGGVLSEAETAVLEKAAKPVLHWLSDYNQTMENAVRLAVFQAGIKQGLSDLKAASLAKNITVNFNKKGQVATQMGALFAFFNANIQGTARLAETLFARDQLGVLTQTGKKIIGGGMLVGALQAFALAMAGFDDDEPPEWLKARSLVIPVPGTDRGYISIPMALGFNLIPTIGRLASETLMHGRPGERGYRFLAAVLDAFSPVGGSSSLLQTIAPTVVKPIVALSENKDWTGRSIYKEDFNTLQPTPGFTRTKATASPWARGLAEIINYATLGTAYTPGKLSPTPDAIDYLIGVATGGMGRELSKTVQTVSAITSGEDLPTYKMPLIGRLVGSAGDRSATRERFYRNLKEINAHELEIKGRRENQEDITGYFEEHPEAKLVEAVNITEREVSALNRRKRDLIKRGASREQVSQIEDRIAARMERLNERVEQMVKP